MQTTIKLPLKQATYLLITILLTLGFSLSLQSLLAAWTAPTANPPTDNLDHPLTEGTANQTKLGGLTLKGAFMADDDDHTLVVDAANNRVGIGVAPTKKFTVAGIIKSTTGGIEFPDGTVQATAANNISSNILSGNSSTMYLSGSGTYTVLCWASYFTCQDYATRLRLDGSTVKTYSGYGADSEGCDQNTIMVRLTGVSAGSHTWSLSRGSQRDYMWMAFAE
jgi:hypothetical protein